MGFAEVADIMLRQDYSELTDTNYVCKTHQLEYDAEPAE
jgi:hypothetical protein